jgi:hypothetical protein
MFRLEFLTSHVCAHVGMCLLLSHLSVYDDLASDAYVYIFMVIYLAASRDRHLAIGFRGLGIRVCYAWLDDGWMLAECWLNAGWMRAEFAILLEFHEFC